MDSADSVIEVARRARTAAPALATAGRRAKDAALEAMAHALEARTDSVLEANDKDVEAARAEGVTDAMLDRLRLDAQRVGAMADGLRQLVALPDPVGDVVRGWTLPNGLDVSQVRVPLGVVGIIYEARPNVTVDAAGLCLKSGNAVLLRGSSSARHSNRALVDVLTEAGVTAGLPEAAVQLVPGADRESVKHLMRARGLVDVLIPRGGADLIRTVVEESTVPVIETGVGNCHVYVDAGADLEQALAILLNAKVQRPSVCNAAETLLVHRDEAEAFLPSALVALQAVGVTVHGDAATAAYSSQVLPADDDDWGREYLSLDLAVRVVDDLDQALSHIRRWGTGHTEAIVTRSQPAARRFTAEVDAAAVMVNASTRFTDGEQFGFGAEIGISTQKLHARGPMGLRELTTTKYVVVGDGQIRGVSAARRIGVMGGTFDPIHHGHLVAASEVASLFSLDEVVFVPTGQPWQKEEREVSPAEDRYLMTVIATASNPRFSVSRLDIDRPGPTFTTDTLRDLMQVYGADTELFFITGADALESILSWHKAEELFELAHFVGVTRPGHSLSDPGLPQGRVSLVEVPAMAISSTDCRERVGRLLPVWYLVPDGVVQYIQKRDLYRSNA